MNNTKEQSSSSRISRTKELNTPIDQRFLNLEDKTRSNPLPWKGQFSPQLVEALLKAYYPGGGLILDPFAGSGTTLLEAARIKAPAIAVEVNPAAFFLSTLYTLANIRVDCRLAILSSAERILLDSGRLTLIEEGHSSSLFSLQSQTIREKDRLDKHKHFLSLLPVAHGMLSRAFSSKTLAWKRLTFFVLNLPFSEKPLHTYLADARKLPIRDNSIEFIITSPPYINVINYHQQYREVVENVGWDILRVAKSEIGSNRKFRQNRFLTVVQYILDMGLSLHEMARVTTNDARIVLIVGRESTVLGTRFANSKIIGDLAEALGFRLHLMQERVFQNKYGEKIFEDILNLSPPKSPPKSHTPVRREEVLSIAREVAKGVLASAEETAPEDRLHLLKRAIRDVQEVQPSPLFKAKNAMRLRKKSDKSNWDWILYERMSVDDLSI